LGQAYINRGSIKIGLKECKKEPAKDFFQLRSALELSQDLAEAYQKVLQLRKNKRLAMPVFCFLMSIEVLLDDRRRFSE